MSFNYRGSWGSPGSFSFEGNLADARAVLAYARDPANAAKLHAVSAPPPAMSPVNDRATTRLAWACSVLGDAALTLEPAAADTSFRSYWRARSTRGAAGS